MTLSAFESIEGRVVGSDSPEHPPDKTAAERRYPANAPGARRLAGREVEGIGFREDGEETRLDWPAPNSSPDL